jgi:hypothetical protein
MLRHVASLGAIVLLAGSPLLLAQEPGQVNRPATSATQAEGTLMMGDKTYKMTHAAAYESNFDGEADVYMVVLSNRPIRPEKIKEVMAGEKDGNTYDYPRPFMKLEFTKDGKLLSWSGGAGNHSAGRGTLVTHIKSELKIGASRLSGSASQPNEQGGAFSTGFDVRFDVALPGVTSQKSDKPSETASGTVSGAFLGNGQEAELAHVRAVWDEPLSAPRSIRLVFTEKDPGANSDPKLLAAMKKFGSALVVSIYEDGSVGKCEIAHTGYKGPRFYSEGDLKTSDFQIADGQVSGAIASEGEVTTKGNKWEVKIKFAAPLGKPKRELSATTVRPAKPKPAAGGLAVKDLPIPKDATNVEYHKEAELVTLASPANVKTVTAELTKSLKAQGWESDGGDIVTPLSALVKRKRGSATLEIIITPADLVNTDKGCELKIVTTGLSWEGI